MTRALILTAKSLETAAVKLQLLGPQSFARTSRGNRYNIWALRGSNDWDRAVNGIEIALYETGRGQSAAIMHTGPIVEAFNPDLVIYIGCAGGEPTEACIGDVFIATDIWNYEAASVGEGVEIRPKGHPICPDRVLLDEARSIDEFNQWRHRIPGGARNDISVRFGQIASGEKIIKHTEATVWRFIKSRLSDEITACETEGHGFLAALSPLKTFGMMIRGISDTLIGKDAEGKAQDDDNQNRASSYAAAFACQLISEIDSAALRGTRTGNIRRNSSVVESVEELVSIEIVANLADVQPIIARLMEISRSVTMTVKKAEQGSIVLVLGMDRKSAVFSKALFDAKLLEGLLGHPVLQCVSSATRSGDSQFDAWVDEVREGNLTGPAAAALSRKNTEWRLHGMNLQTHIRQQKITQGEMDMAIVYIEARPKGRPEGSRIDDYVVEDHADHVLGTFRTQREAIEWAKGRSHAPLVARVRHLNDKKRPDHWRTA